MSAGFAILPAKHTPGEWVVEKIQYERELGRRVFTDRIEIKSGQGLVACMHIMNWGLDGRIDAANARLIAAAPDLLAALQMVTDSLHVTEPDGEFRLAATFDDLVLYKAIAKATGEPA